MRVTRRELLQLCTLWLTSLAEGRESLSRYARTEAVEYKVVFPTAWNLPGAEQCTENYKNSFLIVKTRDEVDAILEDNIHHIYNGRF